MYEKIDNKITEIIDIFDKDPTINKMKMLKKALLQDKNITTKLQEYEKLLINPYDKKCINIKKDLLADTRFKEYKKLEDELFILVLKINEKLRNLLGEKACYK